MLVNTKEMLDKANEKNYGVPHANVVDQHTLKAAIKTCNELHMPLIIGWAEAHEQFITMEEVAYLCKLYLKDIDCYTFRSWFINRSSKKSNKTWFYFSYV